MKKSSIWWQYALPKQLLSRLAGALANCRYRFIKNPLIALFIRYFQVDLREAVIEDYHQFVTFNDFFTRKLKVNARPIKSGVVSPVDGSVSALGRIAQDQILQAKGHSYSAAALLGGDSVLAKKFINGSFLTAYLAPKDYHRIHMPLSARLLCMRYVPGCLFSVNEKTVTNLDNLFAKNERVISIFESERGLFALVAVGALIVGNIVTTWHGVINRCGQKITHWDYTDKVIHFNKGEEIGYFKLGSTVILLFQQNQLDWCSSLRVGSMLRVGQSITLL